MITFALSALFLTCGVILWGTAILAWVRIQSPAVDWFAAVAGTAGAGTLALSGAFFSGGPRLAVFVAICTALFLPVPWLLFCFDYIGREELVSPFAAGIICTPIAVGFVSTVVVFGADVFAWLTLPSQRTATGVAVVFRSLLDLTQFFSLLYAGGVVLIGSGLILWTFQRYPHLDSTTGIALVTFGTAPWISILFGLQIETTSTIAFAAIVSIGFAVGTVAGVTLVGPFGLFSRVPTAGSVGPKTVIEELTDPVLVADRRETIVELNTAATRLIDADSVGRSVTDLFEMDITALGRQEVLEMHSDTGRVLVEPTVSELTDQHDQRLGYAVVVRDVTDRTIRQQRLEVFNRILRHNLRNKVTVVLGHGDAIADQTERESIAESAGAIVDAGDRLATVSENARSAAEVVDVERGSADRTPLAPVVDDVLGTIADEYDGSFSRDVPAEVTTPLQREQLRVVLRHLVENAVEHNDADTPAVEVTAVENPETPYSLGISVRDNGPGMPAHEQRVIAADNETDLEHSTGIGLWIVQWITASAGGTISVSEREPRGTDVSIHLP